MNAKPQWNEDAWLSKLETLFEGVDSGKKKVCDAVVLNDTAGKAIGFMKVKMLREQIANRGNSGGKA